MCSVVRCGTGVNTHSRSVVRHETGVNAHTFRASPPGIYNCSLNNNYLLLTYELDPGAALEPGHGPCLHIAYSLLGHRL